MYCADIRTFLERSRRKRLPELVQVPVTAELGILHDILEEAQKMPGRALAGEGEAVDGLAFQGVVGIQILARGIEGFVTEPGLPRYVPTKSNAEFGANLPKVVFFDA